MDVLFETVINIAIYIFIFKMIIGAFSKKEPAKKEPTKNSTAEPVKIETVKKGKSKKKSKSIFEEAFEQIKKLEELSQESGKVKKKKKKKLISEAKDSHLKPEPVNYINEENIDPVAINEKQIDENNKEIYYNNKESDYSLQKEDLKKAIVYSEIIGKPVSQRIKLPHRR